MKQNRKWILILSIVLSVAIAVGGTMAYLQDTDEDVNVMTLGNVYITQNE
ncbi:MAG: SipW-dependent-type signal peptide-containing protein, partial [Clostridia bacterium]|nr:SipW-dependent-type signal peptide-containing protein [Clostridia bacterium]